VSGCAIETSSHLSGNGCTLDIKHELRAPRRPH
jgi:hypothetical protein